MRRPQPGDRYDDNGVIRRILEVGHAYTVDGSRDGEPDGGYEVLLDNGGWYDAYPLDDETWWYLPREASP